MNSVPCFSLLGAEANPDLDLHAAMREIAQRHSLDYDKICQKLLLVRFVFLFSFSFSFSFRCLIVL